MSQVTFLRQSEIIRQSDVYDDALALLNAETLSGSLEDDLNYIRSKLRDVTGLPDWFGPTPSGFSLRSIHDKAFIHWVQRKEAVVVPPAQNYVLLTGVTRPGHVIALGSNSWGAVAWPLGTAVGSHSTGAFTNKSNVCEIRDASTNNEIFAASGQKIYGLLQVGSGATDGNAFGDTGSADQGQVSFVVVDPATHAFSSVASADIAGRSVEIAYRRRINFQALPETAFDASIVFAESFATSAIDLQVVYDNDSSGDFVLAPGKNFTVDLSNNADIFFRDSVTGRVYLRTDRILQALQVGVHFEIRDGNLLRFFDTGSSNFVGFSAPPLIENSLYTLPPKTPPVSDYVLVSSTGGALSWKDVNNLQNTKKAHFITPVPISLNTSINLSSFINPDMMVFGPSASIWVSDFDVFVNGALYLSGVNAQANADVYYDGPSSFRCGRNIGPNSVIQVVQRRSR